MLPIPFILVFIDKIFEVLKKTRMRGVVEKIENKEKEMKDYENTILIEK